MNIWQVNRAWSWDHFGAGRASKFCFAVTQYHVEVPGHPPRFPEVSGKFLGFSWGCPDTSPPPPPYTPLELHKRFLENEI